jgi:hypothetical protein
LFGGREEIAMFQIAIEYLDENRGWEYRGTITDQTQAIYQYSFEVGLMFKERFKRVQLRRGDALMAETYM